MAVCLGCNKEWEPSRNSKGLYCSTKCQQAVSIAERYEKFLNDEVSIYLGVHTLKDAVIRRDGNKCSCCGIIDWNSKSIVLDLEHKDGNPYNDRGSNLCLLCPNCHSQTPTYKGANKGFGRKERNL